MQNTFSLKTLSVAAFAVCAGAVGSLLTLLVTDNLRAPATEQVATIDSSSITAPKGNLVAHSAALQDSASTQTGNELMVTDDIHSESVDLAQALELANAERAQLAKVLAQLTQQVETLEADAINKQSLAVLEDASGTQSQSMSNDSMSSGSEFGGRRISPQDRVENMVAAGVDPDRAQNLQSRQDQFQLARLELFDLAEREGWAESEQLVTRLEELEQQRPDLRSELGDDGYDRYLFEAGRGNRVVFDNVIAGSAADIAGLQAGDMVIRYADQRVFSTRDLQQATREGVRGEIVALEIDRQGQRLFFEIARGPLGVSLSARQRSPS